MTVSELREILEDLNDDAEVRIAYQPSWPLFVTLGSVVSDQELSHRYDESKQSEVDEAYGVVMAELEDAGEDDPPVWKVKAHIKARTGYAIGFDEDEGQYYAESTDEAKVVYLVEGYGESGYAPREVFER